MTHLRNIIILIPFILALSGCASQQKLMDSVKEREFDVTQDMVDAGMNPYVENEKGLSAFELAMTANKGSPTRLWAKDLLKESSKRAQRLVIDIATSEMTPEELATELAKKDFFIDAPIEPMAPSLLHNLAQMKSFQFTEHAIELIKAGADPDRQVKSDDFPFKASLTPLIAAAWRGNTRLVEELLEAGATASATDREGNTAAHAVMYSGSNEAIPRILEMLAESGANLDAVKSNGYTPLAIAAEEKNYAALNTLVRLGASIDPVTQDGKNALYIAVADGDLELAEFLLQSGASPNAQIREDEDSLLRKVVLIHSSGSLTLSKSRQMAQLLLDNGASVDLANQNGFTALSFAAAANELQLAKLLIENGADVNQKDKEGRTPLFHATAFRTDKGFESAKLLIEKGADVDATNSDGWTALFTAVDESNLSAVRVLIDMGAAPNIATGLDNKNVAGWTPLMNAVFRGNSSVVDQLIEAGADVGQKDSGGWTALMFAANSPENGNRENDAQIVRILVEAGANVDAFNDDLNTPLYKATVFQRTEVLKALLEAGANPNLRNTDDEWTALHAAGFSSDTKPERLADARIGQILLENGAQLERRNVFDYTPLHVAAANGQVELAEVLLDAGANLYATDRKNRTPLDLAKEEGQARVVAEIREAQSNSNPL